MSDAKKVLVVEDEALLLFSIADELRDCGFEVLEASDADEAMELLQKHPDVGLMFTDIDMPGSMDGLRLSAAVRDRWPPVKIIVTSGKSRPGSADLPSEGRFMSKPYTPSAVVLAMREMLG
ncbi:MAG: response regulator [Hyphomicrobiales bacterium]|nr:response regulator [Hyphomicrobiales bacterium]